MRLQFTDILGTIKNVEIPDRQFEEALDGKHHVRRVVDRGVRPDRRVGHVPQARPVDVPGLSLGRPDGRERRPHDLRHLHARRRALRRLPAHDPEEGDRAGRRQGLPDEGRPRGRVLPVPDEERGADHRIARRGELLRPEPGRPGRRRPPRDRPRARSDGLPRRGGPSRGRAGPARDRLPLRRRADDGRQHQHVPVRREERRHPERPARDVHAQADLRHQRLGHAHAHVAVREQRQHLLRREGAECSSARSA